MGLVRISYERAVWFYSAGMPYVPRGVRCRFELCCGSVQSSTCKKGTGGGREPNPVCVFQNASILSWAECVSLDRSSTSSYLVIFLAEVRMILFDRTATPGVYSSSITYASSRQARPTAMSLLWELHQQQHWLYLSSVPRLPVHLFDSGTCISCSSSVTAVLTCCCIGFCRCSCPLFRPRHGTMSQVRCAPNETK